MSDKQEETKKHNVQADDQSIAIGSIDFGGDVSGDISIGHTIGYTADDVSVLIEQISSTFQPKPFDGRCPYKGLDVFEEEDAELFFGREKIVADLVERVKKSRTVFITGPSGSGKSSLVRAGLIPTLKRGGLKNSERWLYETVKPGRDPLEALALAFSRLKSPGLGKYFRENVKQANLLHECAESALSGQKDQRLVLFFDQFEEGFTQVGYEETRTTFLNLLTHAATVEDGRVIILFAMRSDFVSNCATYPELNALLNQQFVQIGAMGADELVSAIAQPALRVGLRIDPDLVAQIINDMQGEPGALPLMQFALKDLFEAEQAKGGVIALTREAYLGRGGIQKSLERHADASFAKLEAHEQELARSIFGGLIEIGRGTQDTRRTALFDELIPASASAEEIESIVRKLADARLITTDELAGKDMVTISHEKLIDAWPWLKKLVNENRDVIALQNQIATDAKEWDDKKRDPSYLYSGGRLANAREQLEAKKLSLSGLAQEYVEVGRARQRRGRVALISTISIIIAMLTGLSVFAYIQRNTAQASAKEAQQKANTARSQMLVFNSQALAPWAIQTKLLIGIESLDLVKKYPSPERTLAEQLMRDSLAQVSGIPLNGHRDSIYDLVFSPDGKWLATLSQDDTAFLWNIYDPSAEPIVLTRYEDYTLTLAFSPDSEWLATGNEDNTTRLWDLSNPSADPINLRGHEGPIDTLVFSPDNELLATGSDDNTARLWNLHDLSADPIVLRGHEDAIYKLAFSPDGKWLATYSRDYLSSEETAHLWNLSDPSGKPIILKGYEGPIKKLVFSPDGKWLATDSGNYVTSSNIIIGGFDLSANDIILWDLHDLSANTDVLTGAGGAVERLAFSPDGKWLVIGSENNKARLWKLSNPSAEPIDLRGYDNNPELAFSYDSKWLVTGSFGSTAHLWDLQDLSADPIVLKGHEDSIYDLAFSEDNKWLATGSDDNTARLWDLSTPSANPIVLRGHERFISTLTFSPDSKLLATGSGDNTARLWKINNPFAEPVILWGHNNYGINTLAISPNGNWLATDSDNNTVRLWDLSDLLTKTIVLKGHENDIKTLSFSEDNKWLATGSYDNTARLWDLSNPSANPIVLRGHQFGINTLAFSPDNELLATGSNDNTARLWKVNDPFADPIVLSGHEDSIYDLAFSEDNKWLATSSHDNTARLWDLSDLFAGPIVLSGHENRINDLAFSDDSKWLATGSDDETARLWNLSDLSADPIILRGHETGIQTLAFSKNGEWLATGSYPYDNTARIWSIQDPYAESIVLRGHQFGINTLAFSPNGEWLATGSGDDTARLWNLSDLSAEPTVLRGHENSISALTFSPDNELLATGSNDGTVRLWSMNINTILETACEVVGRNFARSDWERIFFNDEYRKTCEQWPLEPEVMETPTPTP